MKPTFMQRLDLAVRGLTPLVLTLMLILVIALPLRLPGLSPVTPVVTLMAVYYWSIYRPDLMPPAAAFFVGLVQDTLAGMPLGMTSLVLLAVHAVVVSQRRFFHGKTFLVEWWSFMVVSPAAIFASWAIASVYYGSFVSVRSLGFQLLLTIAFYPCMAWVFARAQHHLLRPA